MPPKDLPTPRSNVPTRAEGLPRRAATTRHLITFVDSQDPNSRSAIQRHTAHHSNAQRRDARLQSLRSNRPRLLQWQRRPSADVDSPNLTTSPQSSESSTSASSGPALRKPSSAPGDISTELITASTNRVNVDAAREQEEQTEQQKQRKQQPDQSSVQKPTAELLITSVHETELENHLHGVCPCIQREIYRDVLRSIQSADIASRSLLLAYIRAIRAQRKEGPQAEADRNEAQRYYGQGTRLLRDRLTKPETASSNENIQAVLLLIAYASDTGATEEVPIHIRALSRMLHARGGLEFLQAEIHPTLMLQLRALQKSRIRHLTLDCGSACNAELRFPTGLDALGRTDNT